MDPSTLYIPIYIPTTYCPSSLSFTALGLDNGLYVVSSNRYTTSPLGIDDGGMYYGLNTAGACLNNHNVGSS